jgi:hypothetical protein
MQPVPTLTLHKDQHLLDFNSPLTLPQGTLYNHTSKSVTNATVHLKSLLPLILLWLAKPLSHSAASAFLTTSLVWLFSGFSHYWPVTCLESFLGGQLQLVSLLIAINTVITRREGERSIIISIIGVYEELRTGLQPGFVTT